jgi:tubulin polyglutamylase TTLL4
MNHRSKKPKSNKCDISIGILHPKMISIGNAVMVTNSDSNGQRSNTVEDDILGEPDEDADNEDDDDEPESADRDAPEGFIRIRPSCIPILPPTVFVDYPPELGIKRNDVSEIVELGSKKMLYKSHWERICIRNAFKRAGFTKGGKNWTAIWSKHQSQAQLDGLNCLQKVNHFPASWCIGRKDRLSRTLQSMKRLHGKEYEFHPDTFVIPQDRESFHRIIKTELEQSIRKAKKHLWIVKPCASSCGRGISVVTSSQAWNIAEKKKVLIQRYLTNPYLINNKKFDLRIYVLVTGVDPLRVYIHNEGLTRISTSDYSLQNISNRFAHLTNYSVNKKADVFKAAAYDPDGTSENQQSEDVEGFKWSLKAFKRWLTDKEGTQRMEEVFAKIHDICVKTIIAAEGEITPQLQRSVLYRTNCFELFGMDVILDENLNPQLLEVNVSPSLMGSSPLDKRIKGMMVADVLHTVGLYAHDSDILRKYSQEGLHGKSAEGNPFAFCNLSKLLSCQGI